VALLIRESPLRVDASVKRAALPWRRARTSASLAPAPQCMLVLALALGNSEKHQAEQPPYLHLQLQLRYTTRSCTPRGHAAHAAGQLRPGAAPRSSLAVECRRQRARHALTSKSSSWL